MKSKYFQLPLALDSAGAPAGAATGAGTGVGAGAAGSDDVSMLVFSASFFTIFGSPKQNKRDSCSFFSS